MEFITGESFDEVCNRYRALFQSAQFRDGSYADKRNLINKFRIGK